MRTAHCVLLAALVGAISSHSATAETISLKSLLKPKARTGPDVPVAVTAVSTEQLDRAGRTTIADLTGLTGYNLNPSAIVPSDPRLRIRGNFADLGSNGSFNLHSLVGTRSLNTGRPTEVSFGLGYMTTSANNPPIGDIEKLDIIVGGKTQIYGRDDDPLGLRVALGGGYNGALLDNINGFAVATKPFASPFTNDTYAEFSVGLRYDLYIDPLRVSTDKLSGYVGARVPVLGFKGGGLDFVGDYGSAIKEDGFFGKARDPYSVGLNYTSGGGLNIRGGWMRQGLFDDEGPFASIGGPADFRFGMGRDSQGVPYDLYRQQPDSFTGLRGYSLNPSALIPDVGEYNTQADYFAMNTADCIGYRSLSVSGRPWDVPMQLSLGMSRLTTDNWNPPWGDLIQTGLRVGGKYQFNANTDPMGFKFALGASYDRAYLENVDAFLVSTKAFTSPVESEAPAEFSLGFRYDRFCDPLGAESNKASVYGGLRMPLNLSGSVRFVGEVGSPVKKDNFFGDAEIPFSVGAEYAVPGSGLKLNAGWQRQGLFNDQGFRFGAGLRF